MQPNSRRPKSKRTALASLLTLSMASVSLAVATPSMMASAAGPAFTVSSSASPTTFDNVGEKVTFSVTVNNTGTVGLDATKPSGAKCSYNGGSSIAAGASQTYSCDYTVTQADLDAGSVSSTATVTPTSGTGQSKVTLAAKTTTATSTAKQDPAMSVTVAASPTQVSAAGDGVGFTVSVKNTGDVTLTSVTPGEDRSCVLAPASAASLAPNATATFTCSYSVTNADTTKASFTKTFSAAATPPTGRSLSASDTATVLVAAAPEPPAPEPADGFAVTSAVTPTEFDNVDDALTFTVTVKNTGGVKLNDTRPTGGKCTDNGGSTSIDPGAERTYTCTYTVTQEDLDAGEVTSSVTVTPTKGTGPSKVTLTAQSSQATATGKQDPALSVTSSPNPAEVSGKDEEVVFTVTVTNTGDVTLTNLSASRDVKCPLGPESVASLAPGASATFTCTYVVGQSDVNGSSFTRGFTVAGNPPSGRGISDDGDATVTVRPPNPGPPNPEPEPEPEPEPQSPTAGLSNGKVGGIAWGDFNHEACPAELAGHSGFGWHFVLKQNSTSFQTLTAEFNTGYVTVGDQSPDADGRFFETTTDTWKHAYVFTSTPATLLSATADVVGPVEQFVLSHVCGGAPSIDVTKTASPESLTGAGQTVTFTVTVDNTGDFDLTAVTPVDTLTAPATGPETPPDGVCPNLSDLPSGDAGSDGVLGTSETWTYTCTYVSTASDVTAGTIKNSVSVSAYYGETEVSDEADASVTIEPPVQPGRAGLSVTKSASPSVVKKAGETVTFTVIASNRGEATLSNLTMSDSLGAACALSPSGSTARDVPGSGSVTYTCTYTVTQADIDAGSITNVATGSGNDTEGDLTDSGTAVVAVEQTPALDVVKSADPTKVAEEGETVTFTVVATNTGNVTLKGLTMDDSLGAACLLSVRSGTPASMPPGAAATYTCAYTVTEADLAAGEIVNVATGTAADPKGKSVTDSDDAVVTAELAAIGVEKSADTDVAEVGDTVTFTVVVTNTGNVVLTNLEMADSLGQNCVLQRKRGNPNRIAPEASVTYTCDYEVTEADLGDDTGDGRTLGLVTNVATGTAISESGTEVSDDGEASFEVAPPVDVQITILNRNVDPNTGIAIWDVTIRNNSNLPTAGPVGVALVPPAGSTVEQDMCDGDQPWKDGAAGQRVWTCSSTSGGISASRPRGLGANEAVAFVVITQGGDLTNLVMGGSITVSGDTVEGNNTASDAVKVPEPAPLLPETGWDPQTGLAIAALLLMVGVVLQTQSRRRRTQS